MHRAHIGFLNPYSAEPGKNTVSPVEQLMASFASHEKRERDSLRDYHGVLEKHDSPLVKYLVQLVIADEEKHHEIVRNIASSLAADLTWDSSGASVPQLGTLTVEDRDALMLLTEELIAEEKHGIDDFKKLLKVSKGYYSGLLELLIGVIIHDSKKHVMMLKFLKKCLRSPLSVAPGSGH